jgi:hypothetical protein
MMLEKAGDTKRRRAYAIFFIGCSSFGKRFLTGCVYHTPEQPVSYDLGL